MRSRTVSLPLACCRSTLAGPPICFASSSRRFISSTSGSQVKRVPPALVRRSSPEPRRGTVPFFSRVFQTSDSSLSTSDSSLPIELARLLPLIPPTEVGGSFTSSLHAEARGTSPKSHPRQWVDCSSPAYAQRPEETSPNPALRRCVDGDSETRFVGDRV